MLYCKLIVSSEYIIEAMEKPLEVMSVKLALDDKSTKINSLLYQPVIIIRKN